jgi:CRP-like cAMP-binding protein
LYYSEVPQGKYVYEIGEPADRFFVVMKGEVSVQAPHTVQPPEEDQEDQEVLLAEQEVKEVVRLPVGEVFGETSMRENAKRAMSVQAIRDCEFFEIKKRDYEIIIKYTIVSAMRAKYMFLEEIELFTKLSNSNF